MRFADTIGSTDLVTVVRHHYRLLVGICAGLIFIICFPRGSKTASDLIISWDICAAVYLILSAYPVHTYDYKRINARAEQDDEGAVVVLCLTVTAAIASLVGIVIELAQSRIAHSGEMFSAALAACTTILSWMLIHTVFAFHYAHKYYRSRGPGGLGLIFPDDEKPLYSDFFYFSFVIGMTFQVSDVQVTDKDMRKVVVAHGMVSFFFDVAIFALTVNIAASLI
jgi:uncharacterized membrane protein